MLRLGADWWALLVRRLRSHLSSSRHRGLLCVKEGKDEGGKCSMPSPGDIYVPARGTRGGSEMVDLDMNAPHLS